MLNHAQQGFNILLRLASISEVFWKTAKVTANKQKHPKPGLSNRFTADEIEKRKRKENLFMQ